MTFIQILIIVIVGAASVCALYCQQEEMSRIRRTREQYPELDRLLHWVGTCKVNTPNRDLYADTMRRHKALDLADYSEYMDRLNVIEKIFDARFNKRGA